jgi:hypothetical protein
MYDLGSVDTVLTWFKLGLIVPMLRWSDEDDVNRRANDAPSLG